MIMTMPMSAMTLANAVSGCFKLRKRLENVGGAETRICVIACTAKLGAVSS